MSSSNERLRESAIRERIPEDRRPYVLARIALLRSERRPDSIISALRLLNDAQQKGVLEPPMPSVTAGLVAEAVSSADNGCFNVPSSQSDSDAAQLLLASVLDTSVIRYHDSVLRRYTLDTVGAPFRPSHAVAEAQLDAQIREQFAGTRFERGERNG